MVTEERVINLEATLASFIEHTDLIVAAIHEDVAEIRASNARTDRQLLEMHQQAERDRQQAERDRKEFNKKLAEISDSVGRLIEDMVAPCGFQLAKAVFQDEEAQSCGIRIRRRDRINPGGNIEMDLLAIGATKALVVEVKRTMNAAAAAEFRQKLSLLPQFFPELAGKRIYPAVASVYLEPAVVTFLTREKIYGIAMGDEVMEVVNAGQF
jgi:hypothetical protein